jgi:magnesium chelatase family protein
MSSARTHSIALTGVEGHLVQVEADVTNGPPGLLLTGMPETGLRETTDRVRAAVVNSGHTWPHQRITVALTPVSLPKRTSCFDAAIAIAILAAGGAVAGEALGGLVLLGELGLDGRMRPISGVLPAVAAAAAHGFTAVAVPEANATEAALVPGLRVLPAPDLATLVAHLRGGDVSGQFGPLTVPSPAGRTGPAAGNAVSGSLVHEQLDQQDQDMLAPSDACRAAEVCAAGAHHLAIVGPRGTGATLLAERLRALLPLLDDAAALEVTAVHSLAGSLSPDRPLITRPPLCATHHTATPAAILGGGSGTIRPGAVSLAHRGVLFLDDAPEFGRQVLDALRQPLDSGEVVIARAGVTARLSARFLLVATARPCPCGQTGGCACPPLVRRRYLGRLAGLWNRVDVKTRMPPPAVPDRVRSADEASAGAAGRVADARQRAASRLAGTPVAPQQRDPGQRTAPPLHPGRRRPH